MRWSILLLLAACVPADEALGLGSVQFTVTASTQTKVGINNSTDGYRIDFDRVILGVRTTTVGKIGAPDTCSYRGRGDLKDSVFRPVGPQRGLVQIFNGISPVHCPDVGLIFGAPTDETSVGPNSTSADIVELAQGGLHAIVDVTLTPIGYDDPPTTKVRLRFNPTTTATRFGGCREASRSPAKPERGTQLRAGERDEEDLFFAAENLFREALSSGAAIRARPFVQADERGNGDGVATMEEIDDLPLSAIRPGDFYQLPTSPTSTNVAGDFPSLGDFVRFLFRFTLLYRSENGLCTGNEPGTQ